jgi:hypothetical protein
MHATRQRTPAPIPLALYFLLRRIAIALKSKQLAAAPGTAA